MTWSGARGVLFAGVAVLGLARCGSDEDPEPLDRDEAGCDTTDFSICGYAFDDLTDEVGRPAYTAPFSSALMRWADDERCSQGGSGVRGRCADGKDFLFFRFGDTTEVRYYDEDGRPVAVVLMVAESTCGDPCPRESFYGSLEDVVCEAPNAGALCGPMGNLEQEDLPFSQGTPLVACEECSP
jgi:hypothetical protein